MKSRIYRIFTEIVSKKAFSIINSQESVKEMISKYYNKVKAIKLDKDIQQPLLSNMQTYMRLIKAYKSRKYTNVSKTFIVSLTAGILYFIMPLDAISDFLPGGFVDDLTIITYLFNRFNKEINNFLEWEKEMEAIEGNKQINENSI